MYMKMTTTKKNLKQVVTNAIASMMIKRKKNKWLKLWMHFGLLNRIKSHFKTKINS